VHAKPSDCLHEISISKTVGHQFWPGLMARAEIWGHREKRMQLRGRPYFMLGGGAVVSGEGALPLYILSSKTEIPVLLGNTCKCGPQRGSEVWAGPFKCGLAC